MTINFGKKSFAIKSVIALVLLISLTVPIVELLWVQRSEIGQEDKLRKCFLKFGSISAFTSGQQLFPADYVHTTNKDSRLFSETFSSEHRLKGPVKHAKSFTKLKMSFYRSESGLIRAIFGKISFSLRSFYIEYGLGHSVKPIELKLTSEFDSVKSVLIMNGDSVIGQIIQIERASHYLNVEFNGCWCDQTQLIEQQFVRRFSKFRELSK